MKTTASLVFSFIFFTGCGSSPGSSSSPTGGSISSGRNASALGVSAGHLVDANGFALYVTGAPCTGGCLTVWPAVAASVIPTANDGLNSSNIALLSGQVSYRGQLLYYFESDTSAGQTSGNGVGGFSLATP